MGGVTEGTAFATEPVLTAQDANGNIATGFTSAVTLNVASYTAGNGGHTAGAVGGCTNPVTAVAGVASFSGCNIAGTAGAGTYTFTGSGGALTSAASSNVIITSGTASQLIFTTQPAGSVGESSAFTTQPVVTAQDTSGNTVTTFTSAVTLHVNSYTAGNGGHNQGALGCTTNPVTAAAGVATFAGCNITGAAAAGTYNFNVTSGVLGSIASNNVTITAGAATQLVLTAQPVGGVTEGTAFGTQPGLTAEDANGNTVTSFTGAVTLHVASYAAGNGGHTAGNIAGCTNPVNAVAGVATFSGCDITGSAGAGTYTFNATGGGFTSAASSNVNIVAGNATAFTIPATPATQTAGTSFGVAVNATDGFGNNYSGTQTVTFSGPSSAPNGVAPTYPATLNFVNGAVTASPITLTDAQNNVTLTVSATGVSGVAPPARSTSTRVARPN